MTRTQDPRLKGRWPEFSRMSQGLGRDALPELASELLRYNAQGILGDAPSAVKRAGKLWPIGPYLRRKLREQIGMAPGAPPVTLQQAEERLRHLWQVAYSNPALPPEVQKRHFRDLIVQENAGKVASLETRARIFKQRKSL